MNLRGKKVFTGRMQLFNGWEIRPFAIKIAEGLFSPGLSARRHRSGDDTGKVYAFDAKCMDKEQAFELALTQGRSLVCEG
jgi:hypothetical protein